MTLTRDRKSELLAGVRLFEGIDEAELERIAERTVEIDLPAGRVIAREGDVGTGFFIVVSGGVDVVRSGRHLAHLGPGEFFGELSVLDGGPRIAQVVATEPTICLGLASWDLEAVLLEEPRLALSILRGLAARLRAVTEAATH
ncbi:MAG: Crp/Fnr family transcriptional regulator [Chloroflexota bacterium]